MSTTIYPFNEQAPGGFNDGEILENRTVVMTHNTGKISSLYLTDGDITTLAGVMNANDFAVIIDEKEFIFETTGTGRLFLIENPVKLGYQTYAESN